jgi:drug/metabolite transporter (DMT)-like permease
MRVKNDRSLLAYILLNIVTCGIYELYFIYSVARDVNRICTPEDRQNTAGLLMFILLTLLTCGLYPYYWFYKLGDRIASDARGQFGIEIKENGTTLLLWMVLGAFVCNLLTFVAYYFLINNLNALASAYNERFDGYYYTGSTSSAPSASNQLPPPVDDTPEK